MALFNKNTDRRAAVAGRFYPAIRQEGIAMLEGFFKNAMPYKNMDLRAMVVPHAGWIFSGQTAAHAYNQIAPDAQYENTFIIGPAHRYVFFGASIYSIGNYSTPYGEVSVNQDLAKKLNQNCGSIHFHPQAHQTEHNIEVQLPFLIKKLKPGFKIIPMLLGQNDGQSLKDIREALQPFFNKNNLFIISCDFSHFPAYDDAVKADKKTALAVQSLSVEKLNQACGENAGIPGVDTSACGRDALALMMLLSEKDKNLKVDLLDYSNSGDSVYGGKAEVVGYWAMALHKSKNHD